MAIRYSYDSNEGLVRIVSQGVISLLDRVNCVRRILDDPEMPGEAAVLINVSEISNAPTNEEIRWITKLVEQLRARFGSRVGIVNSKAGHMTLVHLVALSIQEDYRSVQVFFSEEEACEWLLQASTEEKSF